MFSFHLATTYATFRILLVSHYLFLEEITTVNKYLNILVFFTDKYHCSLCVYNYQNLQEQQTERTPQYDSLMQALITKMDPQLQSKLGLLSEKWIRVKEETYTWHRM